MANDSSAVADTCVNWARTLRQELPSDHVSQDIAITLVGEYLDLVESFAGERNSIYRQEYAYGRIMAARGALCRLCPSELAESLPRDVRSKWRLAEIMLQDYLLNKRGSGSIVEVAANVEARWNESAERFTKAIFSRLCDTEISEQMGFLKGIDSIALHLAQREMFRATNILVLPRENAQAVKLRMRLLSLYLALHRCAFLRSFPAIKAYRETFRIHDPLAYPWWFVDCSLTEKQLNWTYRRLAARDMAWRYS